MKEKKDYNEEDERAIRDLASAMDSIRKGASGKTGESAEKKYQDIYVSCVKMGLKPKMKNRL